MDFDVAFDRLLGYEGKYTNNPKDPGGETNWGITWPILHQAIAGRLVPDTTTIRGLTRDQAKVIYRAFFWDVLRTAHPAVRFQAFDFAVNSGIPTAIRKLQAALGVADDGNWGPVSAAALSAKDLNDVLMAYLAQRLLFMTSLSGWDTFGRGWARRIAGNLLFATQDN